MRKKGVLGKLIISVNEAMGIVDEKKRIRKKEMKRLIRKEVLEKAGEF